MLERLHKILAHAGYGSRRACEELVESGRVTVNGRPVALGDKADSSRDDIRVDGRRVKPEAKVYYLLNKPKNVLSTSSDPYGRRKVTDLLPGVRERVYPVGRLDADSRGLLIMTNDGDLAARLTHPRYEVAKTYEVEVVGELSGEDMQKLISGVWLSEGRTRRTQIRLLHRGKDRSRLEITLREGRNRQIRRMLAKLDHKVRSLTRTRIGPLTLKGLGPGQFRPLTQDEVRSLVKLSYSRPEGGAASETREKVKSRGRRPMAETDGTPVVQRADKRLGGKRFSRSDKKRSERSPDTGPAMKQSAGSRGRGAAFRKDRRGPAGAGDGGKKPFRRGPGRGSRSPQTGRDVSEFTF
jgi:23S rRNA pseudouridine2605 synthase